MDCFNPSFMIGFYDLTLVTSSLLRRFLNKFDIFSTPLDLRCGFYIFFCFATSFIFVLSLVLTLFTYELELVYLAILLVSIIFYVLISLLSWFWLLWSNCLWKLFITIIDIFVSYYTFGVWIQICKDNYPFSSQRYIFPLQIRLLSILNF